MKTIRIGYSPCPNDTFIFDALVHQKIDTEGLRFEPILLDVEALNQRAFKGELEVSKLSYHAMALLLDEYQVLNSGSALGSGVGPLLIAKKELSLEEINQGKIAIPGKYTTANFLLSLAYPQAQNKEEMIFSDIENAVLEGRVDAGLIIHENRFTYEAKGLKKIRDLGDFWEETSGNLIPLGGIVVKRNLEENLKKKIDRLIRASMQYAFDNREAPMEYVKANAQEMDEGVMKQHIELYVNEYSLDLGEVGRQAVRQLFETAMQKGIIQEVRKEIFV